MKSALHLLALLLVVACGMDEAQPTVDLFTAAKQSPAGNWEIKFTAPGTAYQFTVTADKVTYLDRNYFAASGNVAGMSLRGFLIVDDAAAPGGARILWLRAKADGQLDGESTMLLKVESNELVLGGDHEAVELSRLKRL